MCECNFFLSNSASITPDTTLSHIALLSTNCFLSAEEAETGSETDCICPPLDLIPQEVLSDSPSA
jgi:hypothetical protein